MYNCILSTDEDGLPLIFEQKVRLSDLDLKNVVEQGAPLVGSEGKEYESPQEAGMKIILFHLIIF